MKSSRAHEGLILPLRMRILRGGGVLFLLSVVLAGCGSSSDKNANQSIVNDLGSKACSAFQKTLKELDAGILTDTELREKIKDVYSDAQLSDEPVLTQSVTTLLAAVTMSDVDGFNLAVEDVSSVCTGMDK
ncbi:unannotated protein [freshwater metagenome]|uniref:Unannotated protein n=1 Tax=freshwater metagenome TaxID=449393 RepID=A0A6J7XQI1_9ZZZZ